MFKIIGIYLAAFIYIAVFVIYCVAYLIVRYILGLEVELNTKSFDTLLERYGHKEDSN